MSHTFTKLFSSLTESTVWSESYPVRILWVSMLAMADRHGCVWGSIPGVARRAGITLEECEAALTCFLSPDKYSRTRDHDGRRIEVIAGGWHILNYLKYRAIQDEGDKRIADAERQRRHRASAVDSSSMADTSSCHAEPVTVTPCNNTSQGVAQAEANEEVEEEKAEKKKALGEIAFERAWLLYPKRQGGNSKPEALKAFLARCREGVNPEALVAATERYAKFIRDKGDEGSQFVKQAVTFYGTGKHYLEPWEFVPPAQRTPNGNGAGMPPKPSPGQTTMANFRELEARGLV